MDQGITYFQEAFDDFLIDHCKRQEPCNMDMYHYHSSYEIYYLLSGTRNYFIKDKTYRIEKGNIVIINKNDLHKTTYGGSYTHERILINFSEEFLTNVLSNIADVDLTGAFKKGINVIKLSKTEQTVVEQLLFHIIKEAKEKNKGLMTIVNIMIIELLVFIARYADREEIVKNESENRMHAKIADIIKYINSNYAEKLTLSRISEAFYISPYYLSRLFKQATGFTYIEYLNSIRIKEAQRLLETTRLNMSDIAEKTGYESTAHFGRVFKEITGISPLKYRKINNIAVQ